jgi:hypothetical protein
MTENQSAKKRYSPISLSLSSSADSGDENFKKKKRIYMKEAEEALEYMLNQSKLKNLKYNFLEL